MSNYELELKVSKPPRSSLYFSIVIETVNKHWLTSEVNKSIAENRELYQILAESGIELERWEAGGFGSPLLLIVSIANGTAITALASVFKTYLTRRNGRNIVVYGKDGKPLLKATGDYTMEEIESLLRKRLLPELESEGKTVR